jgi:hypothetical protein
MRKSDQHHFRGLSLVLGALLSLLLVACGSAGGDSAKAPATATITPRPASTATPQAEGLKRQAEQTQLPRMTQALADLVRKQAWFQDMSPVKLNLLANLLTCEQAARAHGEPGSVADALQFASEQGWYADGLDDHEAKGLSEVLAAYALSFTKEGAPAVGTTLGTTLRNQTFDTVTLPETGDKVVIVASKDQRLGQKALELATDYLPKIEAIAGKFPYPFIYIEVTPDYPDELLGTSYDEFIGVNYKSVENNTLAHELTHSTVYGVFPTWFEEGFAYFMGNYLSDQVDKFTKTATAELQKMGADNKVDIINHGIYTDWDYYAETRRGFLFVKSIFDIEGIDGLSKTVKSLRSKTYNDNELLAAIMTYAPANLQTQLRKLFCDRVKGATRNYCVGGG